MSSEQNLDYEAIEEILSDAECETSAAEIQGVLCGLVSAGMDVRGQWKAVLVDTVFDGTTPSITVDKLLSKLFSWTFDEMTQVDALAPILLPDDGYPLVDRMECVALWAQGFLLGFGVQAGNIQIDDSEVREAINDLSEISQMSLETEEDEESQQALFTIIEHIKVIVQVIFWELVAKHAKPAASDKADPTIH